MSELTRYGILGCGMMGQEHIRNLNLLSGASVAAIYEPDPKMRNKAHLLAPDAQLSDDLPDLLKSKIDALVISTPNYLHCEQLLEVLDFCRIPVADFLNYSNLKTYLRSIQATFYYRKKTIKILKNL